MAWLGGPRGRRGRAGPIVLHDPPPGYHPPRARIPWRVRQRQAREDWVLMRVTTVVLVLAAVSFFAILLIYIATRL